MEELCEFELATRPEEGFAGRLAAALPGHMQLLDLEPYGEARRVAARVTRASYRVVLTPMGAENGHGDSGTAAGSPVGALAEGARRFAGAREWPVEETREGTMRSVDVKRYVKELEVSA